MDSKTQLSAHTATSPRQTLPQQQLTRAALPLELQVQLFEAFGGHKMAPEHMADSVVALSEAEQAHEITAQETQALVELMLDQGKIDEANSLVRSVHGKMLMQHGAEAESVLRLQALQAEVAVAAGHVFEGRRLLITTIESQRRVLGPSHRDTLATLELLATVLLEQGEAQHAEPFLCEVLVARRNEQGDSHPETLRSLGRLAVLLQEQGRFDRAEPLLRQTLKMQGELLGANHVDTLTTSAHLAELLAARGNVADAEALLAQVHVQRAQSLGLTHRSTQAAALALATFLVHQGRADEARSMLVRLLELAKRQNSSQTLQFTQIQLRLGQALARLELFDEAEVQLTACYDRVRVTLGLVHPWAQEALAALISLYEAWGKPRQAAPFRAVHNACS